ncbi:MAG: pyridoxamine 5'-phosphate oxidase family protein [Acidimicrobiales bacterium]|nr:pyridoxamine 5'-phosphate oxidase family protein [Acidimicrobiales bacterium]
MRLIDERTGLEVLDRHECLKLLAADHIGRVAVVDGGRPLVLPVNYVLDGESVLFRTAPGTKFDLAVRGANVAFEIDAADPLYHTGWSVLGNGLAEEVTDPAELARIADLPLRPWAAGEKPHVVRVRLEQLNGRRIVHVAEGLDEPAEAAE